MIPALNLSVRMPLIPEALVTLTASKSSDATFSVKWDGDNDPIWDDGIGNTFQPSRVSSVSTVTFPWTTSAVKTVTVSVFNTGGGMSVDNFSNTGLLTVDISKCIGGPGAAWNFSSNTALAALVLTSSVTFLNISFTAISSLNLGALPSTVSSFQAANCPNLTSLYFPNSIALSGFVNLANNALTGHLDMSNVTRIGNTSLTNSPGITLFTAPIESPKTTTGQLTMTNMFSYSGPLDISDMWLRSTITLNNFGNLTALTLPTTTGLTLNISITACGGLPSVNLNSMSIKDAIAIYNNPDLLTIDCNTATNNLIALINMYSNASLGYVDLTGFASPLPAINNYTLNIYNNNWSAAIVNHMLVDTNTVATTGFTGRTVRIDNSNAAPDATSGGYDGLAAIADLVNNKGFTVISN